jgi:hypothetical protein
MTVHNLSPDDFMVDQDEFYVDVSEEELPLK